MEIVESFVWEGPKQECTLFCPLVMIWYCWSWYPTHSVTTVESCHTLISHTFVFLHLSAVFHVSKVATGTGKEWPTPPWKSPLTHLTLTDVKSTSTLQAPWMDNHFHSTKQELFSAWQITHNTHMPFILHTTNINTKAKLKLNASETCLKILLKAIITKASKPLKTGFS